MQVDRRRAAKMIGAGAVALAVPSRNTPPSHAFSPNEGLAKIAARNNLQFGCMVRPGHLGIGEPLGAAVAREAAMLVPEVELKWGLTEPIEGYPDYAGAEMIAAFAARHGLAFRGHAGFWYGSIPAWARPRIAEADGHKLVLRRIDNVARHFAGRIVEWDVVNEAVLPEDGRSDGLRLSPFGAATDVGFLADCFHAAHAADPKARLYYNDYSVECDSVQDEARRRAVLNLLIELKRRGTPVHGFGTQSHIACGRRFTPCVYRRFLAEVAGMGLEIRATELDCGDYKLPAMTVADRDIAIAEYTRTYLDTLLDEPAVRGIMAWGLCDATSWLRLQKWAQPKNGTTRPLPLDDTLARKPMWNAIAQALAGAPPRASWLIAKANNPASDVGAVHPH